MALSIPEKKAVLALVDLAALGACVGAALALVARIPQLAELEISSQALWSVVFGLLLLGIAYLNDCLDITSLRSGWRYLRRWWLACAVTAFLYMAAFFFFGRAAAASGSEFGLPRVIPALTLALAALFLPVLRLAVERWLGLMKGRKDCVVVGAGHSAEDFIRKANSASSEWRVCALVDDDPAKQGRKIGGVRVDGTCAELPQIVTRYQAEEVILAITHEMNARAVGGLMACFEQGVDILPVVLANERALGRVPIQHLGDRWLPSTFWASNPMPLFYEFSKRFVDLGAALILGILTAPIVLLAGLGTWITSRGSVLYRQKRVGRHGKIFTIRKIRSMVEGAEAEGARWASRNDPRITFLGKVLRASRIDELPQLWNVLRGEMTLVGPRPERPEFVGQLEKEIPFYRARLAVRPGITGWAQVKYRYGNSVDDSRIKLEYDLYYIKNRSILLDLIILAKTIRIVLGFKGH